MLNEILNTPGSIINTFKHLGNFEFGKATKSYMSTVPMVSLIGSVGPKLGSKYANYLMANVFQPGKGKAIAASIKGVGNAVKSTANWWLQPAKVLGKGAFSI